MTKGWRGTEADSAAGTERRVPWPAAMYGRSCGPTGVSTLCARPTLALRPWRVTRRPSLRSERQLWALRPFLDGGVPALDVFTPDAHPADGRVGLPWAVKGRSGGRERGDFLARNLIDPPGSLPTQV